MEQNGNQETMSDVLRKLSNREISHSEALKALADIRRAQERAEVEARKNGRPVPLLHQFPALENSTVPQSENNFPKSSAQDEDALLTSAEAAKLLGYTSEKSFRNAVSAGKIPHYKLFGQNRFKKSELLGLLTKIESK